MLVSCRFVLAWHLKNSSGSIRKSFFSKTEGLKGLFGRTVFVGIANVRSFVGQMCQTLSVGKGSWREARELRYSDSLSEKKRELRLEKRDEEKTQRRVRDVLKLL